MHGRDEARHSQNSASDRRFSPYIDRQRVSSIDRFSLTNIDRPTLTSIGRQQFSTLTSEKVSTRFSHQGRDRLVGRRDLQSSGHYRREAWWEMWWHLFPNGLLFESLGDRLQRMENTTATMKEKWRRGDEAMRDFTGTWFNKRREEMETCFPTSSSFQHY